MPFPSKKTKSHQPNGFISIVAVGIFALLSVFGIIVYTIVVDTVQNIKNTNNYYKARDVADSISEYLQFELNSHGAGYNDEIVCDYGSFVDDPDNSTNSPECTDFSHLITALEADSNQTVNMSVDIEIKGRSDNDEYFTECPSNFDGSTCYVVPFPGQGDAGELCNLYDPFAVGSEKLVELTGGHSNVHVNYSCNWNKLAFGSNQTDRVTIPLHYEGVDLSGAIATINPYMNYNYGGESPPLANYLALRVRTPCIPCSGRTTCLANQDPTMCDANNERYLLNTTMDETVIMQWQITGKCREDVNGNVITDNPQECGLLPYIVELDENGNASDDSAITGKLYQDRIGSNYIVLHSSSKGIDTRSYSSIEKPQIAGVALWAPYSRLHYLDEGYLTIFLSEALIDYNGENIPYLEYQLLTDHPIGDANVQLQVSVNIEGNIFEKSIFIGEQQPLLDFAVQN
ncbi:hypothetical protein ACFL21_02210 [Patescibacteria group bacterium]